MSHLNPAREEVVLMNKIFDEFMDRAQCLAQSYPEGHPMRTKLSDAMQAIMPLGVEFKILLTELPS